MSDTIKSNSTSGLPLFDVHKTIVEQGSLYNIPAIDTSLLTSGFSALSKYSTEKHGHKDPQHHCSRACENANHEATVRVQSFVHSGLGDTSDMNRAVVNAVNKTHIGVSSHAASGFAAAPWTGEIQDVRGGDECCSACKQKAIPLQLCLASKDQQSCQEAINAFNICLNDANKVAQPAPQPLEPPAAPGPL
eukprot:CAMPEP_0114545730 /NCGR_PEP_ID=MMETSP0114-20121206/3567_1 /TAXON_ID=31324 /ORGANISM="Goniomonas sp, Strain m" /LENGTH=190 /DNA_ID=CAMNT_0001730199 /DNA_START=43 /DNA_END=616 /DNA_ORIENTATION=-